jgi:hypothetical protein
MTAKKLSKHTIKKLRAIQEKIGAEPTQFVMEQIFDSLLPGIEIANCGTAACIAGWAIVLAEGTSPKQASYTYNINQIVVSAQTELELSMDQARRLFYFAGWPARYKRNREEGTAKFARQAIRRIDYFIKTNGR